MDIFSKENALGLLKGKNILFFGDANIRLIYKDFVCLLSQNKLLTESQLKEKPESTFKREKVTTGKLNTGMSYDVVREVKFESGTSISFSFLTWCYNDYIGSILKDVRAKKRPKPDIIIISSCFWDLSRWTSMSIDAYRQNVQKLMALFKECLPQNTLVIWTTTLPISTEAYGGFISTEVEYMKDALHYEVMEANIFAHDLVIESGYNVLDLHDHLQHLITMRAKHGIHWEAQAVRYITNLLLTNIALLWKKDLPGNFTYHGPTSSVQPCVLESADMKLPKTPLCLAINKESKEKVTHKEKECSPNKQKMSVLTDQQQCEESSEWNKYLENIPRILFSKDTRKKEDSALQYCSNDYFTDVLKILKKLKDACDSYKPPQRQDGQYNFHRQCFERLLRHVCYYKNILGHVPFSHSDFSQLQLDYINSYDFQVDQIYKHAPESTCLPTESTCLPIPNLARYSLYTRHNRRQHPYSQHRNRNLLAVDFSFHSS